MRPYQSLPVFSLAALLLLSNCNGKKESPRFELLGSDKTGIRFQNKLVPTGDMNIFNYMYFYNGGGVAVGDLNGDDLPDIYFTSNQEENKLYLNKGDFKFEDITQKAGVAGDPGWTTGVTMADVNGDGRLDIYVSQLGRHLKFRGRNQLYINMGNDPDGIPVFENQASQYGLDLVGYATQAAFFDYDLDGDLDMYMLNHTVHRNGTFGYMKDLRYKNHPTAGDRLLRNDGGFFTDVTEQSGIYSSVIGFGLGISTADLNLDGYPDIYVGNDFHEDDYLYLNNGDGTFREVLRESMQHTSRFSMGNDVGDINNDGFSDIISLDMLPLDPVMLKMSAAEDPIDVYRFKLNYGYAHQFARNTLQLNRGALPGDDPLRPGVRFSEIGLQAGVAATDWSWSALFMDMDNDGWNDLFISNGIQRRSNDMDYINYVVADSIQAQLADEVISDRNLKIADLMPEIKLPNFAYRNNGDLTFSNKSTDWGFELPSFSHGTAYADFDNDGDLDLIINNVNDEAFLYRNLTKESACQDCNHLKISFKGNAPNHWGLGAKVIVNADKGTQLYEVSATRGFQSATDTRLNIGLGNAAKLPELTVIWPGGAFQTLRDVPANQPITLKQADASGSFDYAAYRNRGVSGQPLVETAGAETLGLDFVHRENDFVEFNREVLIPHAVSTEGPAIAIGDVNGDGLDDVYLGGARRQASALYLQQADGRFRPSAQTAFLRDSIWEDVEAAFFDADGDGDLDLFVASGGNEYNLGDDPTLPRLYLNDGKGNFERSLQALPKEVALTASSLAVNDFDNDGDMDVFLGARATPWRYGEVPRSFLLRNNGKGIFEDVTDKTAPGLSRIGFVKDAVWADFNGNGQADLLLACEWSAPRLLLNEKGKLNLLSDQQTGWGKYYGWWNTVITGDFDGDGDLDFIGGNLGRNTRLTASEKYPLTMYYDDFDNNGQPEQLLCYYYAGEMRLFATRDEIVKQLVGVKKKYLKYTDFAKAGLHDIFSKQQLNKAQKYVAHTLDSHYFENEGNGKFKPAVLPAEAQLAPLMAGLARDFNADQRMDALLLGNFYDCNIQMGRYDASYGALLLGQGAGKWTMPAMAQSGLALTGQFRRVQPLKLADGRQVWLAVRNNEAPVVLRPGS